MFFCVIMRGTIKKLGNHRDTFVKCIFPGMWQESVRCCKLAPIILLIRHYIQTITYWITGIDINHSAVQQFHHLLQIPSASISEEANAYFIL